MPLQGLLASGRRRDLDLVAPGGEQCPPAPSATLALVVHHQQAGALASPRARCGASALASAAAGPRWSGGPRRPTSASIALLELPVVAPCSGLPLLVVGHVRAVIFRSSWVSTQKKYSSSTRYSCIDELHEGVAPVAQAAACSGATPTGSASRQSARSKRANSSSMRRWPALEVGDVEINAAWSRRASRATPGRDVDLHRPADVGRGSCPVETHRRCQGTPTRRSRGDPRGQGLVRHLGRPQACRSARSRRGDARRVQEGSRNSSREPPEQRGVAEAGRSRPARPLQPDDEELQRRRRPSRCPPQPMIGRSVACGRIPTHSAGRWA